MRRILIPAILYAFWMTPVFADDPPAPEYDPAHGVARISLLNGDVSVRRGDSGDVVAAAMNAPLVSQDRLLTSSSSRAEIQFDSGAMVRVGSNSEVRLNDVQYGRFQVQLAIGTITFRVLRNSRDQGEIDTPSVAVRPLGPGVYRISVLEDGSSEITVRDGAAEISSEKGSERLQAGSTMLARGSGPDTEFQVVAAIGPDDWDRWCERRDAEIEQAQSRQYVSPDIVGAEDLDRYGRWQQSPEYGNVWVPTVDPGWAPYRAGRWVWEPFYGWTWVSYDPWGWAPYHYGRWFHASFGWGWYPGPIYSRHYWSPALVAFFGFGGRGGFGFGFGNIGWVPLAPFEPFHAWWGRGIGYGGFGRGAIVNNINISTAYRNARVMNGVTAVGANNFGRHTGQFVGMHGAAIRDAGLVRGALPVAPDRASYRLSDRPVNTAAFAQQRNSNFYSRSGIAQNGVAGAAGGRATFGNTPSAGHGWNHFGQPLHRSVADTSSAASSSWRRFGAPSPASSAYGRQAAPGQNAAPGGAGRYQAAPNSGRFGNPGSSQSVPASGYQPSRQSAPQYSYPSGSASYGSGSRYSGGTSQPVRISPPIVHERSAPSGYTGRSAPSYTAPTYRSAPSYSSPSYRSAPSYSAPSYRSTPSYGGGGGRSAPSSSGGGGRYSGGGNHGGGGRSSSSSSSGHGGRR